MQVSFIVIVLCADASRAKNVSGVVYYFLYAFEIETSVGGILWYHTSSVKMLFVTVINSWLTLFVFNYFFLVFLSCSSFSASFVGSYLNLSHTTSSKPHSCHINFAKDSTPFNNNSKLELVALADTDTCIDEITENNKRREATTKQQQQQQQWHPHPPQPLNETPP